MQRCETDQERKHQKQAATGNAYKAAKQHKIAARRGHEWIGMFEGPACILLQVPGFPSEDHKWYVHQISNPFPDFPLLVTSQVT